MKFELELKYGLGWYEFDDGYWPTGECVGG